MISIWTDGACRGNPGPGGWAALLRLGDHERVVRGAERDTTNNRMELMAAIEGLKALKRPSDVRLTTDSEYLRQGITSWIAGWKRNGWKTSARKPVKNQDLWMSLDSVAALHRIDWRWVKGHSGNDENERVDQEANAAIDDLLNAVPGVTQTPAGGSV